MHSNWHNSFCMQNVHLPLKLLLSFLSEYVDMTVNIVCVHV